MTETSTLLVTYLKCYEQSFLKLHLKQYSAFVINTNLSDEILPFCQQ